MSSIPVTPRPSAAVTLLRQGETGLSVFMVRRHGQSAFMPDVYVFPGGSIQARSGGRALSGLCAPPATASTSARQRLPRGGPARVLRGGRRAAGQA